MSTSFWLNQSSSKETKNFDVTIIGAGIAGASTAYWLHKKDPNLNIALIEKNRVAFGASGRNAGFVTCGSVEHFNRLAQTHGLDKAYEIWNFSEKNLQLLKEEIFIGTTEENLKKFDFEEKGSFSLASTENELQELKKTASLMKQKNIPVEELSPDEIEKRLGAINFAGGIKYVSDASVHPVKLINEILHKIAPNKLTVLEGTEVYDIQISGPDRLIKTDQGSFSTSLVVLTTNGYSDSLIPFLKDKIFPTRGQILMTEKVPHFMEGPCYANFVLDYFRQLPSGELLIGGFRQLEKKTEVGYSDHITETIQSALHDFIKQYLPKLKDTKIIHRWAGVMGFSIDGQPLVGSLPNDSQIFFSAGFTAHGLGLAFHSGKILSNIIFSDDSSSQNNQGAPLDIPDFISAKRF